MSGAVNPSMRRLAAALVATALPALPATAHTGDSLRRVAAESGYAYAWSASASEVTLSRPGVTIVLRPGLRRYEINDRVAYASEAPVDEHGDLAVPDDVVAQIRAFARGAAMPRATEGTGTETVAASARASGKLTLTVRQATGRDAIVVDGTAPGALPVTVTLTGLISRDIPAVTLERVTLATDGTYHATLPVAPTMPRGSLVTVTATSLPGVSPASATFTVGPPSPDVDTRFNQLPKDS